MPYNRIVSGGIFQQNCSTPVVEMLSKVQVNRGSLLKSVENLLKTIETSESAVMIPTLLKDKVRVDAWELLFVAKILKASILGHSDLVEFYMNHVGHSSLAAAVNNLNNQTISATSPSTPTVTTMNGTIDSPIMQHPPLSPMVRQSHSPAQQQSPIGSPSSAPMNDHANGSSNNNQQTTKLPTSASLLSTSSSLSSNSSASTLSTQTNPQSSSCSYQSATNGYSGNQRSATGGLVTPNGKPSGASSSVSSISTSTSTSSSSTSGCDNSNEDQQSPTGGPKEIPAEVMQQNQELMAVSLLAARPLLRQAQPPSLLQLTTTNNHINSVAAGGFTNTAIEQLTNQLSAMQAQQQQQQQQLNQQNANDGYSLSISTSTPTNGAQQSNGNANLQTPQTPQPPSTLSNGTEPRINRSAGCLFRANSGASSPRTSAQTPTTPYPQAETLSNGQLNGLLGDPSAPVKLLLQIEQLKSSINHVTNLIDSVVDLYKKSIDNIAQ